MFQQNVMRIVILVAALTVVGCGQTGPLQPPAQPAPQQQPEEAPDS